VIHLQGAKALAVYTDGYYKGMSAVTTHEFGKGRALYQACRDTGSLKNAIFEDLLKDLGIEGNASGLSHGVTAHSRTDGEHRYIFVENYNGEAVPAVRLPGVMTDLLTGEKTDCCHLDAYGYGIFKD
jgi:beta-galactosidase